MGSSKLIDTPRQRRILWMTIWMILCAIMSAYGLYYAAGGNVLSVGASFVIIIMASGAMFDILPKFKD